MSDTDADLTAFLDDVRARRLDAAEAIDEGDMVMIRRGATTRIVREDVDRLVDAVERLTRERDDARAENERLQATEAEAEATIQRVRDVHNPDQSGEFCDHCWTGPDAHGNGASPWWPCATIRALDGPQGGGDATTGCGHPNHGATDHSCAPFTTDGGEGR